MPTKKAPLHTHYSVKIQQIFDVVPCKRVLNNTVSKPTFCYTGFCKSFSFRIITKGEAKVLFQFNLSLHEHRVNHADCVT